MKIVRLSGMRPKIQTVELPRTLLLSDANASISSGTTAMLGGINMLITLGEHDHANRIMDAMKVIQAEVNAISAKVSK